MSIVQVERLTHGFGEKTVLRDVQFRLLQGEHVGLVGPNGAGKSTLLKILIGQTIPDAGQIEWLPQLKPGFLEQHAELQSGTTMRDFLREAFANLYVAERDMLQAAEEMGTANEKQLDALLKRFGQLQEFLEAQEFYAVDAKIEAVAGGLGLTALGLDSDVGALSGGQRTKLLLAKLLLQKPEVLLLDEPTNYLDTAHIEWLTDHLQSYPHAFVLISHDKHFLSRVVNVVYHLEHQTLTRFPGSYQQYVAAFEQRKHQTDQAYVRQQQEIEKLEAYVQKNKARVSTSKQAKSREKRLQKMERIEKPLPVPRPRFSFAVKVEPVSKVLIAQGLSVGFDKALFAPIDLLIKRGEKVALVGYNGIGKTTTLRTLLGRLPALGGSLKLGDRVKPAYFEQEVESKAVHTALEDVWHAHPKLTQKEVRTALARCGLRADHIGQSMRSLSGGEQSKVRLCHLMLADSNLLVLDEPTNHLDQAAKEALQEALRNYAGTVLLVTHEPEFYQGWVDHVWDVERWQ
ncbi:heme ABC transporter ATP-binding protein [Tumebacillus algifaecis]|uniref:Heme ABC transporter ATP-binding protein n=1 Tax=Tumebacillus algifaecis TaxID=1214604 RepID=A0A223D0K4_9BACL|nr:ABC-F family ATP-binding cassette domain-containing protein [Tumebacillus algifaecis]ASS75289.1 heme ABC transporter ATP-binding protein [Tumebacillus algifaecis]